MSDMTTAISSTARVPTLHASRYLQQLCKHWGHNLTVAFNETTGTAGQLDALKGAVARHLDRFAFREAPLSFDWRDL